jgi:3-oxo-5-alpha-steroid 4-dehydrogenase 1
MALVENWLPPTRQNWELVVYCFQFFPLVKIIRLSTHLHLENLLTYWQFTLLQWVIPWYGAGKTSGTSILYLPGRWAWITMEVPGFLTLLYLMKTLPAELDIAELPWQNKLMGALFVCPLSLS